MLPRVFGGIVVLDVSARKHVEIPVLEQEDAGEVVLAQVIGGLVFQQFICGREIRRGTGAVTGPDISARRHVAHPKGGVLGGIVLQDNLVRMSHLDSLPYRPLFPFGKVQEIQVQLVALVATVGTVFRRRWSFPVSAVQDLDDGNGQAHFGDAVQQETAAGQVDGTDRVPVLVIRGPAELVIIGSPGADMVSVVVGGNKIVQFATGNRRREMLNVVHNHLPAVLVYVGFGIDTGGIRAVIVQLVRRGAGRIDQHGGAIGENVIERFTATAVDGMDIHISLCPGRHDLTHFELLGGGCLRGGGNNGPRGRVVLPAAAREDYGGERHE